MLAGEEARVGDVLRWGTMRLNFLRTVAHFRGLEGGEDIVVVIVVVVEEFGSGGGELWRVVESCCGGEVVVVVVVVLLVVLVGACGWCRVSCVQVLCSTAGCTVHNPVPQQMDKGLVNPRKAIEKAKIEKGERKKS